MINRRNRRGRRPGLPAPQNPQEEEVNQPNPQVAAQPNPPMAAQPDPQANMMNVMGQLAQMLNAFIQSQNQQHQPAQNQVPPPVGNPQEAAAEAPAPPEANSHNAPLPPPPPPRPYRSTLPDFIKSNRYFEGAFGKPDEAEDWLAQVERSFTAFEVPHHLRLEYGTYMLRFNARVWWESKRRDLIPPVTWEAFRREFLENYFPGSLRVKYSADFLHISQRGRTIEQYETEFSHLLQYAPESYKHSEELKREVFLGGLDEDLRMKLEEFDMKTFRELVEKARVIEGARRRKSKFSEKKNFTYGKRTFGTSNPGFSAKRFKPFIKGSGSGKGNFPRTDVTCWKCKGSHYPRKCPQLQDKCFFCGDSDHKVMACPKKTTATCFMCKEKGHIATNCPQRRSVAARPFGAPSGPAITKSGTRSGSGSRAASAMHGMRIYNLEGQWMYEEDDDDDEEAELAALNNDGGEDYGLVTG